MIYCDHKQCYYMIRSYKPSDHEQVKILLKDSWMYYEKIDNAKVLEEKIQKLPWSILVYEENNQIIWCCFITYDPSVQLIYHLCVKSEFRSKWIWKLLVWAVEKLIKEKWYECQRPFIFVEENNKEVLDFYEKLWYKLIRENVKYFMLEKDLKL